MDIRLRSITEPDVAILFEHQLDADANQMAAVYPRDENSFRALWNGVLKNNSAIAKAIVADDTLVGHVTCFKLDGQDAIGYWIAKDHWGRGIATKALALFLNELTIRPLLARVATHNIGSIRVLERNGFKITGYEHSPGTERYVECEEAVLILE